MYIIKNAITSIVRNKGRNILIGIIILVISCAAAVTLAIHNSATSLIDSYKEKYEVEATLSVNRENMMGNFDPSDSSSRESMQEAFSSASNISVEDIEKYANSNYVKSYYYTMSVGANANDLETASATTSEDSDSENTNTPPEGMRGGKGGESYTTGDFTLTGYSTIESMTDFIEGTYKVTDGEVFSDFESDSCLINSELAEVNDISVGDKITVVDPEDDTKTYELTVTGIFEEESEDSSMSMFSNSANTIITNTTVLTKIKDANEDLTVSTKPTFNLTSSGVVESFTEEVEEKGLSEYLTVSTNLDEVEQSTSAISNLSTFAVTFLIIAVVIGVVVLLFINMINIRERKYEIGVLRTIGMKKSAVAAQFMCELIIIAFASLLIGAGIGSAVSVPVANHLLENEIESSTTQTENINQNFGGRGGMQPGTSNSETSTENKTAPTNNKFNGVANVQKITSIKAVVDIKVLCELLGIGLVITIISGASALISIERFSPLTILKERS